jgi:hypothetical protein
MLDSDLAARSASLARIYSDLGFQQRALVEGYNSVNSDPSNYSAHRFLADSYAARPRHEIARVSELLQSQLLQPTNITPIQPRLAESNLQLISSGGAGNASFSEFNPLFNRNQIALLASGLIGENSTGGGEAVVSGIYNKASFSIGYSKFKTDGWRINNDQEDDIGNAYLQYELNYKTSLQAEYRHRDNDRGDVNQYFFEDNFFPTLRQEDETDSGRIGLRHAFSPNSVLLANVAYQTAKNDLSLTFFLDPALIGAPPPPLEDSLATNTDQDAWSGELQHLFQSQKVKTVAGGGYFNIDQDILFSEVVTWPGETPPALIFAGEELKKFEIKHTNLYIYSYLQLADSVNITAGASGDFFDLEDTAGDEDLDNNQFNPKVGITWTPTPDTTLRGAVFRTLKRTLITDQTLEPTQVAGFNQFFDDPNSTKAWLYGGAADQKFSSTLYGGAEYFYRDMDVPYLTQSEPEAPFEFMEADWEERLGRAYLYWTPHNMISLSVEYLYEKLERAEEFTEGAKEVKTHRFPLGANYFHPSGFTVSLKGTYWNQDGIFERTDAFGTFQSGDDTFWVVDAAIGYRLPKRYGFITVGVTNLLDESFQYFETDVDNSQIQPERFIFGRLTLAFP